MPIYEFYCEDCNEIFEEILPLGENNFNCKKCNKPTQRIMSSFLGIVKGSSNRSIDCVVGEDSDRRWNIIEKRKENRLKKEKKKCSRAN